MLVRAILSRKGADVFIIGPDATVAAAIEELRVHRVGALIVSSDGTSVSGIVSERDVVRHLAELGHAVLDQPVAAVMTVDVVTCAPSDSTEQLMGLVTERRIRHVPVVENDRLTGLVSIGDIVAARVHELEDEAQLLHDYISAR
jgi:CBS domain-containing protein